MYKIRKDSDSWEYFDPSESNIFVHLMFVFGTGALIVGIALLVVYMIVNNIVP